MTTPDPASPRSPGKSGATPPPYTSPASAWVWLIVVLGGVAVAVAGPTVIGIWGLAALCAVAAIVRVAFPQRVRLIARGMIADVVLLCVLGAGLAFLAATTHVG